MSPGFHCIHKGWVWNWTSLPIFFWCCLCYFHYRVMKYSLNSDDGFWWVLSSCRIELKLRLQELYQGIVYPWNPRIHGVVNHNSWFGSYCGSQILTWKDSFRVVDHKSSQFSKDLTCFHESSWVFSSKAQNESLKIRTRKSQIRICRLASPNLKDSICGFVSEFFF